MSNLTKEKEAVLEIIKENKSIVDMNLKMAKKHIKLKGIKKASKKKSSKSNLSFYDIFMEVAYDEILLNAKDLLKEKKELNETNDSISSDISINGICNKQDEFKKDIKSKEKTLNTKYISSRHSAKIKPLECPPPTDNTIVAELSNPFTEIKRNDGYVQIGFAVLDEFDSFENKRANRGERKNRKNSLESQKAHQYKFFV